MELNNNQMDLTDQELQQVTGGTGIGFGFVSGAVSGLGNSGSANGAFLGYGEGDHLGFGFANGRSFVSSFDGTFPFGGHFSSGLSYAGGQAFGFGY